MAGFHEAEVRRRLEEKNREERAQAKLLIGMGIPFAGAALFGLTFVLSFLLWALSLPYWAALLISFVVVAAVLTIDTWRHPSEHWPIARYYEAGKPGSWGTDASSGLLALSPADRLFAGIPVWWGNPDPVTGGERMLAGCANIALGGPRNIRKGLEQLQAARAREDAKVVGAASLFLDWLQRKDAVTEEEVAAIVAKEAAWNRGFALAGELGFLTRRKQGPQRLLELKVASSVPFDPEG